MPQYKTDKGRTLRAVSTDDAEGGIIIIERVKDARWSESRIYLTRCELHRIVKDFPATVVTNDGTLHQPIDYQLTWVVDGNAHEYRLDGTLIARVLSSTLQNDFMPMDVVTALRASKALTFAEARVQHEHISRAAQAYL